MRIWTTVMGQRLDGAENTRSMLLCAELVRRGHDVTMWTSAYDHIRKQWRSEWHDHAAGYRREDNLEIRFMKGLGYRKNVSARRFLDHYLAARDFARTARRSIAPDVIVTSLPDHITAAAAVAYAKERGIPVIVDVRDKWPDVFVDRAGGRLASAVANLALFPEHRRAARALREADSVVAVMRSLLEWAVKKASRPPCPSDRVFYLTTSPKNFDVLRPAPIGTVGDVLARCTGRTVFVFVGTFNETQHPALILDAIDILARDGGLEKLGASVIIAGDGIRADEVRRRASTHRDVHYVGWVDAEQMSALLAGSHIGLLVMNFPSPAFNNKAFAYLASGLPIINGATGDLAELIDSGRAGVNVRAGDPKALAAAMSRLAADAPERDALRRNTRALFTERFDREANYRAFADHVERMARREVG
jgi:glycosyltransferase involved in cell wall biosynthesis